MYSMPCLGRNRKLGDELKVLTTLLTVTKRDVCVTVTTTFPAFSGRVTPVTRDSRPSH